MTPSKRACERCARTMGYRDRLTRCGACSRLVCCRCRNVGGSGQGQNASRWCECFDCQSTREAKQPKLATSDLARLRARRRAQRQAPPRRDLDADGLRAAVERSRRALDPVAARHLDDYVQGVFVGRAQPVERFAAEIYRAFEPVRAQLRRESGTRVLLFRGEPRHPPRIARRFLSWTTDEGMARDFADQEGHVVRVAKVDVDDVVGAIVGSGKNYVELLVKDRPRYHEEAYPLPWSGAVFLDLPVPFSMASAEREIERARAKLEAAGYRFLRAKVNEEDEGAYLAVAIPRHLSPRRGDSIRVGDLEIDGIDRYRPADRIRQ